MTEFAEMNQRQMPRSLSSTYRSLASSYWALWAL